MNTSPPTPAADDTSLLTPAPTTPPLDSPWAGVAIDFLIAVVVLFGTVIGGTVVWGVYQGIQHGAKNPNAAADPEAMTQVLMESMAIPLMFFSILGMALAALAVYFFRRRATPAERRISKAAAAKPRTWVEAIGLGIGLFALGTALMWGLGKVGHAPNPSNMQMLEAAMAYSPAFLLLLAVVAAPLSEELLFRRGFFGRFWAAKMPMTGMIVSSVLFAFAHEVPGTTGSPWLATLILLLFYAGMGAALAWIYRRTETLWAPIATHATNNLLGCAMMMAGYTG